MFYAVLLFTFLIQGVSNIICAETPLAVYLTWQHDPTTTMTVRWISTKDQENDILEYKKKESNTSWKRATGFHEPFAGNADYLIHTVELTQLSTESCYSFRLEIDKASEYLFQTMPKTLQKPIVFVEGGDTSADGWPLFEETCKEAAKEEPLFTLFGGDLAYAERKHFTKESAKKNKKWIQWLTSYYKTMITPSGRMVPILAAIGNHDVSGYYNQSKEAASAYHSLFPIPGLRGYEVLCFGNYLALFFLDSGHTSSISGEQTAWLKQTLIAQSPTTYKIPVYHVPAYPSARYFRRPISSSLRRNWIPLFEKYGVRLAFEHHDHCYKRTYPLTKDCFDPHGVVYIGDGAWGAHPREPKIAFNTQYLAKTAKETHFIKVELTQGGIECWAINNHGKIFDHYDSRKLVKR